jgi:hypothetical protein
MDIKLGGIFLLAFFVLTGLAILAGLFWIVKTEKRFRKIFMGKKANDLEESIIALGEDIKKLTATKDSAERELSSINKKLKQSIRGLGTVRFNPFPDQGSNQSFAIGIMNEEGDGVIISSLYSRERMSIFAKPVKGGKSEYELTNEEKEALKKAEVR